VIGIRGLHAGYGRSEIVHGVDLAVRRGEIVALFGANGAGKTTTLAATIGIIPRWRGRVFLDGADVSRLPIPALYSHGVAYVPEHRGVFAGLSVEENLRLSSPGIQRKEFRERLDELGMVFPMLTERRLQSAGTLSGGQRQQLAIGRALIRRPKVLIIDEMSLGLAPVIVSGLFHSLHQIAGSGVAVLLVEQHIKLALNHVQRAYVMQKGRIVAAGSAADFVSDPALAQASYLGAQAIEGVERLRSDTVGPERREPTTRQAEPETARPRTVWSREHGRRPAALAELRGERTRTISGDGGLSALRSALGSRRARQRQEV